LVEDCLELYLRVARLNNTATRIISGVFLLLLSLAVFIYGGVPLYVFIGLVATIAVIELRRLLILVNAPPITWLLYMLVIVLVYKQFFAPFLSTELLLALGLLVGFVTAMINSKSRVAASIAMGSTLFGAIYLGLPIEYYLRIYTHFYGSSRGMMWTLLVLLSVAACDTMAYFVGRTFGKHRFFPRISPKKTVEGAVGGIVGSFIVSFIMGRLLHLGITDIGVLSLVIGVSAQLGDLFESLLKRNAGVKDSGTLIPGHGGILDRIDAALIPPVFVYYLAISLHMF
jgi:phosphatidate cytidylyltransferase